MNIAVLAVFFKDFANMLVSGIGLEHSLRTLSETASDQRVRSMCAQTLLELELGTSLTSALLSAKVLPREALMSIEAGERAGELATVFLMLGEYFEIQAEIRSKITSALVYPLLVITILLGVLFYVAIEVLPKVAILMPANYSAAPLTGVILQSAGFIKHYGLFLVILLTGSVMGVVYMWRSCSSFILLFLSKVPVFGQLIKEKELSLAFFTIYLLQKSGVPLDMALKEAAKVAGGEARGHIDACSCYLMGGLTLSEAVRLDGYFPRFTADTLRVGEESGRFTEYFERLYKTFYRLFRSRMESLSEAIRPALLVVSAAFIMLIAFGFLQPLYGNLSIIATP